ncbi:hypothetical protein CK203_085269 [Vitis vinifera]|uniref:Uncharacterized protein n=1 Tax=Vitis vinifera TaxID=29760 RepID=A0A438DSK2_VITVI|nr:hypothetical protein CK203_085269 [Vitis vinifera]
MKPPLNDTVLFSLTSPYRPFSSLPLLRAPPELGFWVRWTHEDAIVSGSSRLDKIGSQFWCRMMILLGCCLLVQVPFSPPWF